MIKKRKALLKRNQWIAKGLIFGTLLSMGESALAQTEVTVGVMRGKDYGVTYILPRTEVELTLQVTHHTFTPGEYAKYAERYLYLKNVALKESDWYTIDQVKMRPIGTPNKEQTYFVKLRDKSVAPLMELTEEGIVRSINMPFSGTPKASDNGESAASGRLVSQQTTERLDPRSFLTEEILVASSSAKRAELIAKEIYNIRESRNALLRGEADNMPQDGEQLKLMLDNLNRQEKAMTEMFAGHIEEEIKVITLHIPVRESKGEIAFRFSRHMGVVEADNLAGEPYLLVMENLTPNLSAPLTPDEQKKQVEGVAYNVPGRAHVQLLLKGEVLYDQEFPVAQFGTTEYLAPVLFNKTTVTKVLFDVNTGGLFKVMRE